MFICEASLICHAFKTMIAKHSPRVSTVCFQRQWVWSTLYESGLAQEAFQSLDVSVDGWGTSLNNSTDSNKKYLSGISQVDLNYLPRRNGNPSTAAGAMRWLLIYTACLHLHPNYNSLVESVMCGLFLIKIESKCIFFVRKFWFITCTLLAAL